CLLCFHFKWQLFRLPPADRFFEKKLRKKLFHSPKLHLNRPLGRFKQSLGFKPLTLKPVSSKKPVYQTFQKLGPRQGRRRRTPAEWLLQMFL
ncbi:MAG: hypothetical protein MI742_17465, partial [Desulfobacterales bacterium]|nr:hypothetical protein [Desulfobacterales bacterium]